LAFWTDHETALDAGTETLSSPLVGRKTPRVFFRNATKTSFVSQRSFFDPMPENQTEQPLTTGEWLLTHLVLMIPLVNFVMLFVWGFGDGNISVEISAGLISSSSPSDWVLRC